MHDPHTVAFEIRSPFRVKRFNYRETWLTVWHKDPERDGSDDSCGWTYPNPSEADRKIIAELVEDDLRDPYFSSRSVAESGVVVNSRYQYRQLPPGDAIALVASAWSLVGWRKGKRRELTWGEFQYILHLCINPFDNLRSSLCDLDGKPKDRLESFFSNIMRHYNRHHRPWYRHPRWHFWHWRIRFDLWYRILKLGPWARLKDVEESK